MLNKRKLTLRECCLIQKELNDIVRPNWNDPLSNSYLSFDHFNVAILDEVSELLGSVNWKWWKKEDKYDLWNLKIEAIDIFHFFLSILILDKPSLLDPSSEEGKQEVCNHVIEHPLIKDAEFNYSGLVNCISDMITYANIKDITLLFNLVGMNSEEISAVYVAKATLNKIRQEKGYQKGTYQKTVNGIEDNQTLQSLVEKFLSTPSMTLQDIETAVRTNNFS